MHADLPLLYVPVSSETNSLQRLIKFLKTKHSHDKSVRFAQPAELPITASDRRRHGGPVPRRRVFVSLAIVCAPTEAAGRAEIGLDWLG